MRNTITRSFVKNSCTCLVYNDGKTNTEIVTIPYGFNTTETAERYIRKNALTLGKLIMVEKIEKISALYGMEETTFIENARLITERDKTTRDCITKTVVGKVGTLVYMDENRAIREKIVRVNPKENLDKQARKLAPSNCKGITIENLKDSEQLYAMDEATFIKLARPMHDHQHYINE